MKNIQDSTKIFSQVESLPYQFKDQLKTQDDLEESAHNQWRIDGVEKIWRRMEILADREDGVKEFDFDKIQAKRGGPDGYKNSVQHNGKPEKIRREDILNFLRYQRGVRKNDPQREEKPVLSLPKDLLSAQQGEFEDGLIFPWDLKGITPFKMLIKLDDGSEVNLADLFYLKRIKDLKIHRNAAGKLEYFDEKKQSFADFYSADAPAIFGRSISFMEKDGSMSSFEDCAFPFIKKYLPVVDSLNLFKSDDFRRKVGSRQSEALFSHDRLLTDKPQYLNISGSSGMVRYYLGRKKLVGTEVDKTGLASRELDKDTVGIIGKKYNQTRLLYTFSKLTPEEYVVKGFDTKKDVHRLLGAEEMEKRITEYRLSDYLPQRLGESAQHYADRLSKLNDVEFITNNFRELMSGTGVSLYSLSWTEQILIANYILETNNQKELLNFVSQYKESGLRAFLAVEADLKAAKKIMDIGANLPEAQARLVFDKISALNTVAIKKAGELSKIFFKSQEESVDNQPDKLMNNVYKYLFQKSGEIINNFSAKSKSTDQANMLADLDRCQAEMVLLAGVLRESKSLGSVLDMEVIKDLNLHIKDFGEELPKNDKEDVLEIARENWNGFGNQQMADAVIGDLEKNLQNTKNQRCYVLKYKEQVIGFVRFEKTDQGTLYAGSFNVSKDLRGLNIGNEMMEQAIIKEGKDNILEASASIKIPAGCAYIEKVGFVADGLIENYHGTGESLFNIRLDQQRNKSYRLKNIDQEEPIDLESLKSLAIKSEKINKNIGEPVIVLSFSLPQEQAVYQEALSRLLPKKDDSGRPLEEPSDKYTLTRYFQDKSQPGDVRYLVFEKN